jgi:hypothetical protein
VSACPEIRALLAECARAGLLLTVEGGQLFIEPPGRIAPALRERLRARREDLISALDRPRGAWAPSSRLRAPESGSGSSGAVGQPTAAIRTAAAPRSAAPQWGRPADPSADHAAAAAIASQRRGPADLTDAARDAGSLSSSPSGMGRSSSADQLIGAVGAEQPSSPRARVALLLRQLRKRGDRLRAIDLRDAWEERLAICCIDGALPLSRAQVIACDEVERLADGWGAYPSNREGGGGQQPPVAWAKSRRCGAILQADDGSGADLLTIGNASAATVRE